MSKTIGINLEAGTASFISNVERAGKSLEDFGHSAGLANELATKFIEGLGIGSGIEVAEKAFDKIKEGIEQVREGFERVGEIGRASVRLGISPEEFSKLKYAAEVTHVSAESLEADMGKMLNSIQKASEGDAAMVTVFQRLHLNIEQIKDLSPSEAFERIGDAISHVANRAERMNDVREIFGRAGSAILPMIENLRQLEAESDRVGFTRTEEEVKKVEEAEIAWAKATKQVEAAFMDLASNAGPALASFLAGAIEGLRKLPELNKLPAQFGREHNERMKQYAGMEQARKDAIAAVDATPAGTTKRIEAEERLLEVLKKERDFFQKQSELALNAGDQDTAKSDKQFQLDFAKDIEAATKELAKQKESLKEYKEFLDEMLSGEEEPTEHKKKHTTTQNADALARGLFGFSLRDLEDMDRQVRDAQRKQEQTLDQEMENFRRLSEDPAMYKYHKQVQELDDLLQHGRISHEEYASGLARAKAELDKADEKGTTPHESREKDFAQAVQRQFDFRIIDKQVQPAEAEKLALARNVDRYLQRMDNFVNQIYLAATGQGTKQGQVILDF